MKREQDGKQAKPGLYEQPQCYPLNQFRLWAFLARLLSASIVTMDEETPPDFSQLLSSPMTVIVLGRREDKQQT